MHASTSVFDRRRQQLGIVYLVGDEKLFGDISFKSQKDELQHRQERCQLTNRSYRGSVHVKDLEKGFRNVKPWYSPGIHSSPKIEWPHPRRQWRPGIVSTGKSLLHRRRCQLVFFTKTPACFVEQVTSAGWFSKGQGAFSSCRIAASLY